MKIEATFQDGLACSLELCCPCNICIVSNRFDVFLNEVIGCRTLVWSISLNF